MPITQVTLSSPAGAGTVNASQRIEAKALRCVSVTCIDNSTASGIVHARVMFSQNGTGNGEFTAGLIDACLFNNQSASWTGNLEIPDGAYIVLWCNSLQAMKTRLSIHTEV